MRYFLDTNIIIGAINNNEEAKELLYNISREKESEIFINRLVELESLRTITYKQEKTKNVYSKTKNILDKFEKLEITYKIYKEAIEFSRYCTGKGLTLKGKCAAIDFLHFITSKEYDLKLISLDKDIDKLEEIYEEFLKEKSE